MKELSELMAFSAHPDLKNGVTPNVAFFEHMYTSMSAGSAEIALSSVTAATLSATQFEVPYMSISAYTLTADHGGEPSSAITGYYGEYLDSSYICANTALEAVGMPAENYANEIGYFKWASSILDSVAPAISGAMAFSHSAVDNILDNSVTAAISDENNFITITAHVWNLDEPNYEVTSSDLILYIKFPNGFIAPYPMLHSYTNSVGDFESQGHFYWMADISSLFTINKTYYYWIKCSETWGNKTTYSGTGEFYYKETGNLSPYDISSVTGLSGDTTGYTRGLMINNEHRALAVSVNAGAVTGGSDWYWRNIFNTSWSVGPGTSWNNLVYHELYK